MFWDKVDEVFNIRGEEKIMYKKKIKDKSMLIMKYFKYSGQSLILT